MDWRDEVRSEVKRVEEEVEGVLPRSYAASLKVFLDKFMPFALILLGSLLTVNFLVPVNQSVSNYIAYVNWALVSYFSLRLAMAFRLAESDRKFLRQHWFDAMLVIPAFTLVQEFRALRVLETVGINDELFAGAFMTNLGVAAQLSKIIRIIKRSLTF